MTDLWDRRFLDLALLVSTWSKDPSTKVGAVIVDKDRVVRSIGYNGFPRGIGDTEDRLTNRDTKYKLVVHAEMNAILNAVRSNIPIKDSTLYVIATSQGKTWGGPPCTRCTVETIQSGIANIVVPPLGEVPERWVEDMELSFNLLKEAGINYKEV